MRKKWTRFVRAFSVCTIAATLSACQEDLIEKQQVAHEVGFYAGGVQTRTTMLPNGLSAVWEPGDELAVWAKNSAGEFTLQNQIFKTHGVDGGRGFFTSVLNQAMPEGIYTYLSCYPVPAAVNGTKVTFNIPALQDGKASGGVDVMIADPTENGALTAFPVPDDHSTMKMKMNRMMHQFRFYVPEEDQLLGDEKFERIYMTFPTGVTGNVTFDVADPDASAEFSDGQTDISLELAQPIGVSKGDAYEFACLAMAPVKFEEGQKLQITKAYTDDKIAFFDPIDLNGKTCLSGHSTPVKLKIRELIDYPFKILFTVAANNLGEGVNTIRLEAEGCDWKGNGSNVFEYTPGHKINAGEVIGFYFDYHQEELYRAFSGKNISVTYDSDHATMYQTVNVGDTENNDASNISLTVPYLFFEDFSTISDFGFDVVTGAQGTAVTGYDLSVPNSNKDNVNPGLRTGWTGARTGGGAGQSIRVGSRVDRVAGYTHTYGRLDSPALSSLKSGVTATIKVTFNYSGGRDGNSGFSPRAVVGTTTTSGPISGTSSSFSSDEDNWTGISDYELVPSISTNGSYTSVTQSMTHTMKDCNAANRISWQIRATGSGSFISNGNQWMFIDNIRVQIAN